MYGAFSQQIALDTLATHLEWVWSFCVVVNIANTDIASMGKVRGCFVSTYSLSFRASGINTWLPCSSGLAMLASVKQVCANPHA